MGVADGDSPTGFSRPGNGLVQLAPDVRFILFIVKKHVPARSLQLQVSRYPWSDRGRGGNAVYKNMPLCLSCPNTTRIRATSSVKAEPV